ncbi:MAG: ABC transporter permease [Candidatus Marinimicrobia bacterium]|nr:ABC transporter permease [Candidatus Neomarinimicrobiota bacterium]
MAGEFFIAKKYFFSKKRVGMISATAAISILGFAVGVWALITALSVLGGFEREVREKILTIDSHIKIEKEIGEGIEDWESLINDIEKIVTPKAVSPYLMGKAVIKNKLKQGVILLKGTNDTGLREVTDIASSIVEGSASLRGDNMAGIIIGRNIAERLLAGIGDTVTVINPLTMNSPFSIPQTARFEVTGIFSANIFDYDDVYSYVHYEEAQKFMRFGKKVTGIEMSFSDFSDSFPASEKLIESNLEGMKILTWFDLHRDLLGAMKLEKLGAFVVLSLIILVAGFNVVSSLVMMVMTKRREIGILKAMGANDKSIRKIFVFTGMFSGGIGVIGGSLIGLIMVFLQNEFGFIKLPSEVYFISVLPVDISVVEIGAVIFVSVLMGIIATIYPSRKASNLDPIEAIRYE